MTATDLDTVRQETLEQIPQFALPDEERGMLADLKARQEVLGEAPGDDYFELLDQAAEGIEQGYQAAYLNAGVEEETAALAATGQRQQFLGESVADEAAAAIAAGEEAVQSQRREYGRVINALKDQYSQEVGRFGSQDLMESAAQIRTSEQVYGNEPTEKQQRLLKAADLQRRDGIGKQLQQDYESAGAPSELAQSAGSIKAQESVFGIDLSDSQQRRVDQADRYLTSVEGQLGRRQQQQFMESQVVSAYREGRTSQALEDAGVDPELASRAAKIEVSSGGEPQSEEDAAILSQAYASAGQDDSMAADIAANAERFMATASAAGITAQAGDAEIAQGNNYSLIQTGELMTIQNRETGGLLVAQGGEVLAADGMDEADQERFSRLGQLSADDLQNATQRQPAAQRRSAEVEMA